MTEAQADQLLERVERLEVLLAPIALMNAMTLLNPNLLPEYKSFLASLPEDGRPSNNLLTKIADSLKADRGGPMTRTDFKLNSIVKVKGRDEEFILMGFSQDGETANLSYREDGWRVTSIEVPTKSLVSAEGD